MIQHPVIDLFAGPGGLGEGFSAEGFDVRLSVEKDKQAHRTLELRAFFRQFDLIPDAYCRFLKGEISLADLYAQFPRQYKRAAAESLHCELGRIERSELNLKIRRCLRGCDDWVLIGGPPCQAYSLVGRSRNKGIIGYTLDGDDRATLYREYLRVIADHWPSVFIMENVRGLLSSRLDGEFVFDRICNDLHDPASTLGLNRGQKYELHSLASNSLVPNQPSDFIVRAEKYGVPQARAC